MSPTQSVRRRLLWVTAFLSACLLVGTAFLAPSYAAGRDGPADKAAETGAGESPDARADAAKPGKASSHENDGTAGTSGNVSEPQPRSKADKNGTGANQPGPYDSTRDGSPSLNGKGDGKATGKPCAGCVGKADNKNPKGQLPDGSDHNAGYECDRNQGIGKTNPAHTGCKAVEPPKEEPPKVEPPKEEPPKVEPPKEEPPKVEPPKVEPPKEEPPKEEPPVVEPPVVEPPNEEPPVEEPCVDNPETTEDECGEVAPPVAPPGGPNGPEDEPLGGPASPTGVTEPPAAAAPAPAGDVAADSSSPAGSALPQTGQDAWLLWLLALGLAALTGGAVLLRRVR